MRGDLIQCYEIFNGIDDLRINDFFDVNSRIIRGHPLTIRHKHCYRHIRSNFFSFRVVPKWNSLPANIVTTNELTKFKSLIDEYYKDLNMFDFD